MPLKVKVIVAQPALFQSAALFNAQRLDRCIKANPQPRVMFAYSQMQALHQQGSLGDHCQFWMLGNKLIRDMQIADIGIGPLIQYGLECHVSVLKQQSLYLWIMRSHQLFSQKSCFYRNTRFIQATDIFKQR